MELRVKVGRVEDMEMSEPVSPTGQYFNSSVLSVSVIAILEFDNPIDDSSSLALINNVFLPINPRFSSIMVTYNSLYYHYSFTLDCFYCSSRKNVNLPIKTIYIVFH